MTKDISMASTIQRFFTNLYQDIQSFIASTLMFWRLKRQQSANTSDLPSARMTLIPSALLDSKGEPLTWTCHVCGERRPDARIGVLTRERTSDLGVRFRENVRHCNDRRKCAEGAKEVFFVMRGHEEDDFAVLDSPRDPDNDYEDALIEGKLDG